MCVRKSIHSDALYAMQTGRTDIPLTENGVKVIQSKADDIVGPGSAFSRNFLKISVDLMPIIDCDVLSIHVHPHVVSDRSPSSMVVIYICSYVLTPSPSQKFIIITSIPRID